MTIVEFLLARIAETISDARHVQAQAITDGLDPDDPRAAELRIARYVIAECEAKRRVVSIASETVSHGGDWQFAMARTLRLLAQPYADHADYDDAWRP